MIFLTKYLIFAFKIFLTTLLAYVIGHNRQKKNLPVGGRTHVIVALIALLVQTGGAFGGDILRLSGQFLTGIGFLCSGIIFKSPDVKKVRGLTTSAVIFYCGVIGITIGLGLYTETIMVTLVVLFFLYDPLKFDINRNLKKKK